MATLDEARKKIAVILQEMDATHTAYTIAADTYNKFTAGKPLDMSAITMYMQIDAAKIQLPLPYEPQEVADRVAAGCNLLAEDIARQWQALYAVASDTLDYIQRAQEQVAAKTAATNAVPVTASAPASVATTVVAMHTVPAT